MRPVVKSRKVEKVISHDTGYTGEECPICHSYRMKRNGSCSVCENCGITSGCS